MLMAITGIAAALLLGVRRWTLHIEQVPFDATAWQAADVASPERPSVRQEMISDLVTRVLPGKCRKQIEGLLGESCSHASMRRHARADFANRHRSISENRERTLPQTGEGWYFDEYDWDLLYPIGKERNFLYDHRGVLRGPFEPDDEYLVLRLDAEGQYDSWFIIGSLRWPDIVDAAGREHFRPTRRLPDKDKMVGKGDRGEKGTGGSRVER